MYGSWQQYVANYIVLINFDIRVFKSILLAKIIISYQTRYVAKKN
jgi:hypothetical protein